MTATKNTEIDVMDLVEKLGRVLNVTEICSLAASAKGDGDMEGSLIVVGDMLNDVIRDITPVSPVNSSRIDR